MRPVGTIAGGLAAAVFAFLAPVHAANVVLGLVALVAAIAMQIKKTSYAVYAFALTAAVVAALEVFLGPRLREYKAMA